MSNTDQIDLRKGPNPWRIAGWSALAALLALPAIAMQFTGEVQWTGSDFVFAAILLIAVGIGVELAFRVAQSAIHRAGMLLAVAGGFLTLWLGGAVGVIGEPGSPLNLTLVVLTLLGVVAGLLVSFRPRPMVAIMAALAAGQIAAMGLALVQGEPKWQPVLLLLAIWGVAGLCFRRAA